jgi:pyruvate dehydrogenase E1 component beta subunit
MHFADFITVAMDEVVNQMAKIRYMFGGQCTLPIVLRAPDGIIRSAAAQHSQSLEAWFLHVPGLKVVIPSNPADAKGLLKAAIRSDDPVLYFEHKALFPKKGPVPEGDHVVPIGKANVTRSGKDVTIVSYSLMMHNVLESAGELEEEGIDAEVIDLRTISPLDTKTIFSSVKKTKRLVIVHEAVKTGGVGAEIAALVAEEMIDYLDAPIKRLGAPFVPIPFSPALERLVKLDSSAISRTVREICQ